MTVRNPCLSGGAIEVFLEPAPPAPRVLVVGDTPIARRCGGSAPSSGSSWSPSTGASPTRAGRPRARRRGARTRRAAALRRGLEAGLPYVGLVASAKRGAGVLEELRGDGVPGAARAHRCARRPRHRRAHRGRDRPFDPREGRRGAPARVPRSRAAAASLAVDPICGMTVAAVASTPSLERDGETFYFCSEGCKAKFEARASMPPSPADPFVTGLVLGAGGSKRLGRPKQLLALRRGHAARPRRRRRPRCGFDQTIAAIGGSADEVRAGVDLAGAEVVVNEAYGEGCSSSIAAALGVVDPRCDVLVLMLGDQPGVTRHGRERCSAGRGDAPLAVCRYDDGHGHPIAFARSVLRRARRPARRQGGVAAARPARRGVRGCRSPARSRSTSTPPRTTRRSSTLASHEPRRSRRGGGEVRGSSPTSRRWPSASPPSTTSSTRAWRRRCSSACACPSRCCSRARRASARPRRRRSLAAVLDTPLIRLQCYEGIDAAEALYEWNYPRQLLSIRLADASD